MFIAALFIICLKLEITWIPINWQMNQQNVASAHNTVQHKQEWSSHTCEPTGEPGKLYTKWNDPDTHSHTAMILPTGDVQLHKSMEKESRLIGSLGLSEESKRLWGLFGGTRMF